MRGDIPLPLDEMVLRAEGQVHVRCPKKWMGPEVIVSNYNRLFRTNATVRMPFGCSRSHTCYLCSDRRTTQAIRTRTTRKRKMRNDILLDLRDEWEWYV
jgi:hypothetical protein